MNDKYANISSQEEVGLTLAVNVLPEAAQGWPKTTTALSAEDHGAMSPSVTEQSSEDATRSSGDKRIDDEKAIQGIDSNSDSSDDANTRNDTRWGDIPQEASSSQDLAYVPDIYGVNGNGLPASEAADNHPGTVLQQKFQQDPGRDTANLSNFAPLEPNTADPCGPTTSTITPSKPLPFPNQTGRWYISLQEAFDAIPFISAQVEINKKVVCYVLYGPTAQPFGDIFARMTNHNVICPSSNGTDLEEKMSTFKSLPSGLLLVHEESKILSMLGKTNTLVYWGASPKLTLSKKFKATRTYVLISNLESHMARNRATRLHGIREHPQSARLNSTDPRSPLQPYRNKAREVMETVPTTITNKIYLALVTTGSGSYRKAVVARANLFAAQVFLHGNPEDGSNLYPPIRLRPSVKPTQLSDKALRKCANQGLVRVE
ncbi:hypothetical protein B0J17DRAFT_689481 [Rhizoctonia solani]|nr:hypothetical protein B0J17DRAFT_689481 [Rhizoctonia solani]